MVNLINIVSRTTDVSLRSGFRRLFTLCNSRHDSRVLHKSIRGAPNLSVGRLSTLSTIENNVSHILNSNNVVKSTHGTCISLFSTGASTVPLTKIQAQDLILRLTDEERSALLSALQEFQSEKMKAEYEGQLAGVRWRSKFGRPSKLPGLGDVDPTGSFCPVPEDWLARKYAESVPLPTTRELWKVTSHNGLPFIGFGFLDNFVMIVAGDSIEASIGSMVVISTMAAAALGNTISDVMGIGSAWYVERLVVRVGIQPPKLSPVQLDMPITRKFANLGRVLGVTVGCLLGMLPLMFLKTKAEVPEPSDHTTNIATPMPS